MQKMLSYLDAVLKAVKLSPHISLALEAICPTICGFALEHVVKLTSQQELAIWQPAWPTVRVTLSVCVEMAEQAAMQDAKGACAWRLTVQANDFSHIETRCSLIWLRLLWCM